MRRLALTLLLLPALALAAEGEWASLPGGEFHSALRYQDGDGIQRVSPYQLQVTPVSNREFLAFVSAHPAWRRGQVPDLFAEPRYLKHWQGPLSLGPEAQPSQPVVNVSWFAAQAYCEAQGARLPSWNEWEMAAAADETRADARADPAWRERILSWYSVPSNRALATVGQGPADLHGVRDLHGLVWEWVDDYAAMLVLADNREQGDADSLRFCGAGALALDDRENYAVLMRVAMLSSLQAHDTTANLGFRCARNLPESSS
jgi:formylglycine-generating enzyme